MSQTRTVLARLRLHVGSKRRNGGGPTGSRSAQVTHAVKGRDSVGQGPQRRRSAPRSAHIVVIVLGSSRSRGWQRTGQALPGTSRSARAGHLLPGRLWSGRRRGGLERRPRRRRGRLSGDLRRPRRQATTSNYDSASGRSTRCRRPRSTASPTSGQVDELLAQLPRPPRQGGRGGRRSSSSGSTPGRAARRGGLPPGG